MKLLLTSAGLTNKTIVFALEKLLQKPIKGTKLTFIPTAANVEEGHEEWLKTDINNCEKAGFEVNVADIQFESQEIWLPKLEAAEVLLFGGGNSSHLMHWVNKSGLANLLPELLKTRVYMGISAGSCITCPTILNPAQDLFEETYEIKIVDGLNLVNLQFIPHLNSIYFTKINKENLEKAAQEISEPIYALDDNTAMVVNDGNIEVVSEGDWFTI